MQTRRIYKSGLFNILFLIGFLFLMFVGGSQVLLTRTGNTQFILLAAIVFIPSLISTMFFYFQDRREPEPVSYIIYAYLAGIAAVAVGVIPLWEIFLDVQSWIYASISWFILGSFLVAAPIVSMALYGIIRYIFVPLDEFDEPVDGMVYGSVAGVGMAFAISFQHLITRPDCTLFVVAYVSTTHILIYSAVGALIGYILGKAKFSHKNIDLASTWAIFIGTLVLGIYRVVNEFIFIVGLGEAFWLSFVLTLMYALVAVLYGTLHMRKLTEQNYHEHVYSYPRVDIRTGILVILVLILGFGISIQAKKGKIFEDLEHGLFFRYAHSLSSPSFRIPFQGQLLVREPGQTLFSAEGRIDLPFQISVKSYALTPTSDPSSLMKYVDAKETESLAVDTVIIGGKKGKRLAYSYLIQKDSIPQFPQLMQVYKDVIFLDNFVVIFIFRASSQHFEKGLAVYQNLLQSVEWKEPVIR